MTKTPLFHIRLLLSRLIPVAALLCFLAWCYVFDTVNIVFGSLLTLLAIAGLCSPARTQRLGWGLLTAILFLYPLIHYVTHVTARYRHPLDPFLLLLTCVAIFRPAWASIGS